jgi:hypothetical protein
VQVLLWSCQGWGRCCASHEQLAWPHSTQHKSKMIECSVIAKVQEVMGIRKYQNMQL